MTKQPTNVPQAEDRAQLNAFLLQALPGECIRALNQISLNLEYSQRCLEEPGKPLPVGELRQSLSDARVASNRLDRTMDSLFRLLACAQEAHKPQWEAVELCGLLQSLCADGDAIRAAIGVRVTLDCGGQEELYITADRSYLECICLQLLSNALRACRAGGHVELRLEPGGTEHRLCVLDDGCGLPGQAAEGENREHFVGGAGLGLRLCGEYCRLLGWALELAPRAGGGTQAVLRIPAALAPDTRASFRSGTWEEMQQGRQLRRAVCRELHCVPGLETAELDG